MNSIASIDSIDAKNAEQKQRRNGNQIMTILFLLLA